jgi:formyl-CoA transferase
MNAPYAAFRCRDGYFALAAGTNKLWETACEAIGRPDVAQDERFGTPVLRGRNQDALREILETEFAKHDAGTLLAMMRERGVPCAPINKYSQVLDDPQVEHMGWVEDVTLPGGARSKVVISPQRISGQRLGVYRNPPALGEHTQEVLAEIRNRKPGYK